MTFLLIVSILLLLLITSTPISIALGMTVLVFMLGFSTLTFSTVDIISQRLFTGLESFAIMAVPFFVLSGQFLIDGKIAARIIRFANNLVGWMPGGMAMAAVVSCAFFATISGSSPATVMAIGSVMLPAMVKAGYPKRFGVGVIATSGSLGILIPPSIVLIIYAVVHQRERRQAVHRGYRAGSFAGAGVDGPGVHTGQTQELSRAAQAYGKGVLGSFLDAWWGLFLVVIVIGGIYGGIFTPTEAAAVAAVYAFLPPCSFMAT